MRRPTMLRVVGVIAIAMAATSAFAQKQPHSFLKTIGGFTDKDLAKLDDGAVISTTLKSGIKNELAFMGAVRIKVTIQTFLENYHDIETFEAALGIAKKLSDPPKMSDLEGLEFEKR